MGPSEFSLGLFSSQDPIKFPSAHAKRHEDELCPGVLQEYHPSTESHRCLEMDLSSPSKPCRHISDT